jgi:hypothetical protein
MVFVSQKELLRETSQGFLAEFILSETEGLVMTEETECFHGCHFEPLEGVRYP